MKLNDFITIQLLNSILATNEKSTSIQPDQLRSGCYYKLTDKLTAAFILFHAYAHVTACKRAKPPGYRILELQSNTIDGQFICKPIRGVIIDELQVFFDAAYGTVITVADVNGASVTIHESCNLTHDFLAELLFDIRNTIAGEDKRALVFNGLSFLPDMIAFNRFHLGCDIRNRLRFARSKRQTTVNDVANLELDH